MARFADSGLERVFGEMPGKEHVARFLKNRAQRELTKLDEATLHRYLAGLEALMRAVRTGEEFEPIMQATMDLPRADPEEAA